MFKQLQNLFRSWIFRQEYDVYTDGSQKGAWGSWAFVVVNKNKVIHESSGRQHKAASNRMEFQAALNALDYLSGPAKIRLFTDSRILIQAMTDGKKPKAHHDQITDLQIKLQNKKITWTWVKAHSGIKHNERCDELCIQARATNNLLRTEEK